MAYIRNFNQADWFFNPGKVPGGLEPTGAAAPALPGSPAAKPAPAPPVVAPPSAPTLPGPASGPQAATPAPASEPAEESEKAEAPPILETKGGSNTPIGLYILGGVGVLVLGIFLYKKFAGDDEEEVGEVNKPTPALEARPVTANRKKNRK